MLFWKYKTSEIQSTTFSNKGVINKQLNFNSKNKRQNHHCGIVREIRGKALGMINMYFGHSVLVFMYKNKLIKTQKINQASPRHPQKPQIQSLQLIICYACFKYHNHAFSNTFQYLKL